jgi:hypothetical protein
MTALQGTYIERFVEGAQPSAEPRVGARVADASELPQDAARCRRSFSACCPRFASWTSA